MSATPAFPNRLLHGLPHDETAAIEAIVEPFELLMGDVLCTPRTTVEYAVFPHSGVVSLVADASEDTVLELALFGSDGMLGLPLVLGAHQTSMGALVQATGEGSRIPARAFVAMLEKTPVLRSRIDRFANALMCQLAQTIVCNSFHSAEQRTARWMLEMGDRSGSDELRMTQAFIADMLGVRRPAISHAASALLENNLVSYSRGTVRLLDRAGLEKTACPCYAAIRPLYQPG